MLHLRSLPGANRVFLHIFSTKPVQKTPTLKQSRELQSLRFSRKTQKQPLAIFLKGSIFSIERIRRDIFPVRLALFHQNFMVHELLKCFKLLDSPMADLFQPKGSCVPRDTWVALADGVRPMMGIIAGHTQVSRLGSKTLLITHPM